ncbi:hypothetical protein ACFQI7_22420 [Paenibacillus allorhizosphaerae]|uniref:Uncharacterized protein n=1 Tax=Paenibacillus allorhizosphaerae TaxID=2849866 RepID=A0ABN7TYN1_9BACL|nr:hypothetical protein [Paenibacillus allorhizosphaerae]CAG7657273.1 hypothetical protein PAECIP111802_06676 [Paenibacillus allorhizosphaerae]
MKRLSMICLTALLLLLIAVPVHADHPMPVQGGNMAPAPAANPDVVQGPLSVQPAQDGVYQEAAYRSGRRPYTGGRTSPAPGAGARTGTPAGNVRTTPGTNPANPATGYPNRGTGLGGLFGGFAAGALLGSLFNPFGLFGGGGYGTAYGGGMSFLSLIFWGVVIYFVIRLFRRARDNKS